MQLYAIKEDAIQAAKHESSKVETVYGMDLAMPHSVYLYQRGPHSGQYEVKAGHTMATFGFDARRLGTATSGKYLEEVNG